MGYSTTMREATDSLQAQQQPTGQLQDVEAVVAEAEAEAAEDVRAAGMNHPSLGRYFAYITFHYLTIPGTYEHYDVRYHSRVGAKFLETFSDLSLRIVTINTQARKHQ